MKAGRKKIAHEIEERIKRGESLRSLSKELAAYLMLVRRTSEIDSIMRDVVFLRAEGGNVEATVTSAHALSAAVKKEVNSLVKTIRPGAKRVVLDEKLDTELIGGLKLSVVDRSLDLSIRAKLNKLKQLANQGGI